MALAIIAPGRDLSSWKQHFRLINKRLRIEVYPYIRDPQKIVGAVLWKHPKNILKEFPNLKWVSSMGAGVDHIINEPSLPRHVPITRIIDDKLPLYMARYVTMAIMAHQKNLHIHLRNQRSKNWLPKENLGSLKIGIMGMGNIGRKVAQVVSSLEFPVFGYSNSPKDIPGVTNFYGQDQLDLFLRSINILVCLLPLTPSTKGILNYELFRQMNPGTYLINVARGGHLNEEDLLHAIADGYISGACLDVFNQEPLPQDHPFWEHESITITPHIASVTNIQSASEQIIENYQRLETNLPLVNLVDVVRGY
ncbi:glyoxylate/hydroxypyruvate reductase A [Fulvivirgaceae bacterium BMA10]|uniref:Glyoxylate/hydroxypyruvate reductase A n=1 Tax=Splendidivirga corallicola TaxID=3051826 RepID=A0ABT8KP52_9BACT|nr:glyoxylate/hydroxypyruvate reductase A [Fulvivirgaceae bacterium BMA10]